MKMIDDVIIIGIDSGYGNIKTANCCFPASLSAYDREPVFKENLLVYESKFYLIGEGHKEFLADKTRDLDYYVLALAAIARELNIRKMTCGKIRIAAGLPLTWVSGQRDEFRDYLLQNKAVDFSFRNVSYHVEIVGVDVFPQGFAAVADRLSDFRGVNMICDIGNGTMNIMFINDKKPVSGNMFTEKYGTHQCLLAVRENVMRAHHTTVDEAIINRVFRFGTADIKEDYLKTITDTATDYVEGIFQRLREHEYNPELMRLYVLGGGSCLIRNFGVYDASRVTINDDICATAKGYEYAADEMKTEKRAYVTCLNLHSEETAAQEFMETKRLMHNEGGRSCYHGYQSFKADEVDADTAHSIGVALARELWGDRFQVVIATHCNTGHYHNHFVINSVSDVDGKKFYNSPADYRRMREVSDRLCREAKISVIEYPADRRVNYGEWLAEKNGKPTMRSRIREDIDRAILASTTEREFLRMMKEMGYEVITKTPKGSPRVHPIIRIVDGGKNFRLDKLGEYYELDSIKQRIQNNYRRKTPFPEVTEDTKAPYYQYKEKAKKVSGLYALHLYYCYELHIIVHKPTSVKKVSAFLREDVTKLDRYIAQADFLAKTGIETVEALSGYKAEKEKQVEALTQQRTGLKNELKRHIRKEDFQSAEATRARIAELTTELKTCRKDITLCSDIADRSEQVRKNLEQIEQQKIERKEKTKNELLVRGSSRAGREDDTQRR